MQINHQTLNQNLKSLGIDEYTTPLRPVDTETHYLCCHASGEVQDGLLCLVQSGLELLPFLSSSDQWQHP